MQSIVNKRIAIIGGAGFIGHHMAITLKAAGAEVLVIDSLQINNLLAFASPSNTDPNRELYYKILNNRLDLIKKAGIEMVVQDTRQMDTYHQILQKFKPQVMIHLAAVSHAGKSNKDPHTTFDHSLITLENSLQYAKENVEHFIYFSSSMVYGNFESGVVDEETVCNPLGIYGSLKFAGEKMVIAYNQVFKLPYTIIRPSALYGPGCVSRRVIQIFIESAIQRQPIKISGGGEERLDFTFISDLVDGIQKVIENPNSRNQLFNLTYGRGRSVAEMAELVKAEFPDVAVEYLPKDDLTPSRGTLSIDKAKKLIGYEPKVAIETGIPIYIKFYRELLGI